MRLTTTLILSCLCAGAWAEQPARPDVPPPPALNKNAADDETEPQVTITEQKGATIEEYRAGGRLYMIKVIPKVGKPYFLVDERGDGKFSRQESLDTGLRPPMWTIHRF
ncbi:MAG TPA: DUF2782 domain-containing protein [Gallionellaceae bacterium]